MDIKEFIENIGVRNIKVSSVEDMGNYKIITIQGELKIHGKFDYYLQQVMYVEEGLKSLYSSVWVISWINDCMNNMWALKIGIKK